MEHIFKRKLYDKMLDWKQSSQGRSALLIQGARRVGKSTIAEQFAKNEYESHILIDFSKCSKDIRNIFDDISDLDFVFNRLQVSYGISLTQKKSVIIFETFHDFVKEHMKTYSRRIEMGTFKHHLSCMKKFKAYNELLQFQDLTPDYLTDYLIYMKKELGNTEITAQRNMSTIKIYVTAA